MQKGKRPAIVFNWQNALNGGDRVAFYKIYIAFKVLMVWLVGGTLFDEIVFIPGEQLTQKSRSVGGGVLYIGSYN